MTRLWKIHLHCTAQSEKSTIESVRMCLYLLKSVERFWLMVFWKTGNEEEIFHDSKAFNVFDMYGVGHSKCIHICA